MIAPYFGDLGWREILELRNEPGIEDFRRKMREIQEEEIAGATSGDDLRERVHRRVEYDLSKAAQPGGRGEMASRIGLNVTLGIMSGGLSTAAAHYWI